MEEIILSAADDAMAGHYDDKTRADILLFVLGQLIFDENLDHTGLEDFLAMARAMAAARPANRHAGITSDTMTSVAMTLRLADDETEALRRRAELEHRSMQEVARQAIREYVENHSRAELLDQVLDEELPRYAEALKRLGQ
jgi:Ribbon-helix-helix protein, copG family